MRRPDWSGGNRREWIALAALVVFTALSVGGYWNFALHPERLPETELAARFFTISFQFFAQLHILVAFVALAVVLVGRLKGRWIPAFAAVYALSFLSEHLGTGYGVPFGGYGYTGLLGWKLGGRVPALIPVSWFLMALASWTIARAAVPERMRWPMRITLATGWLVAWDLALDPAMSFLTPYWMWDDAGPYYGMPWVNLAGWSLTGMVLMSVLEVLAPRLGMEELPTSWMATYYGLVVALPLGMVIAAGLWPAVGVTLVGLGLCLGLTRAAVRKDTSMQPRRTSRAPQPATAP
ncbi:MAG: carotenoid biosynthesis protein [Gemmatimonadota bacterium]